MIRQVSSCTIKTGRMGKLIRCRTSGGQGHLVVKISLDVGADDDLGI